MIFDFGKPHIVDYFSYKLSPEAAAQVSNKLTGFQEWELSFTFDIKEHHHLSHDDPLRHFRTRKGGKSMWALAGEDQDETPALVLTLCSHSQVVSWRDHTEARFRRVYSGARALGAVSGYWKVLWYLSRTQCG